MSDRSHACQCRYMQAFAAVLLIVGAVLLTGCAASGVSDVTAAVELGIILPVEEGISDAVHGVLTTQASVKNFTSSGTLALHLVLPVYETVFFENSEGTLTYLVERWQIVREGDTLARLTFDDDVRIRNEITLDAARARLAQFERDFIRERHRRQAEIYEARSTGAPNVRQLETALEQFAASGAVTRDTMREEIAALSEKVSYEVITAPFDGMADLLTTEGQINGNPPIIMIVDYTVFYYEVGTILGLNVPNLRSLYSIVGYGDIVTLRGSGMEFQARVVTDAWAAGQRGDFTYWLKPADMEDLLRKLQELDSDNPMSVLFRTSMMAHIDVLVASDAVAVPTHFVHRMGSRDYVLVNTGHNRAASRRFVHTGVSIGGYVQIITGLEPGEEVILP